jgi:hypothetical protein
MVNRNLFLAGSAAAAIESDKPRQRWAGARLAPAYPATVGISAVNAELSAGH